MPIEIEKLHTNLEGHSVLIIESFSIAELLGDRLSKMERMRIIKGSSRLWENGGELSLNEWVKREKVEAVIIHPYNCGSSIKEIIQLHEEGCKVLGIGGNKDVEEGRRKAYEELELHNIPVVTKELILGEYGLRKFMSRLIDELSVLFKK